VITDSTSAIHAMPPTLGARPPLPGPLITTGSLLPAGAAIGPRPVRTWLQHGACGSTAVKLWMPAFAPLASIVSRRGIPDRLTPGGQPEVARSPAQSENGLLTPETEMPGGASAPHQGDGVVLEAAEIDLEPRGAHVSPPPVPLPVLWEGPQPILDEPLGAGRPEASGLECAVRLVEGPMAAGISSDLHALHWFEGSCRSPGVGAE